MKASDPQNGELSPGDDSPGVAVSSGSSRGPIKARGNQSMMISIVAIAIGASLGALLRWYLANRLNSTFPQLPPGTLVANILGA
jgi:predicted lysophospholipase L1 biosynthesis ABC-type transport system permease subunit